MSRIAIISMLTVAIPHNGQVIFSPKIFKGELNPENNMA